MRKKFSVIMPVYNVEKYLDKSIESLLKQTYKNFELLIINDGSKDKSQEIIEKYSSENSCIKSFIKENGGLSDARNYGLDRAQGEYIIFIDSDDYVEENYLECVNSKIEKNKIDLLINGYFVDYVDENEQLIEQKIVKPNEKMFNRGESRVNINDFSILGYAWNKVYRSEIIRKNKLYFKEGISYVEDIMFNSEYIKKCDSVYFYNECFNHYIQRTRETLGKKYYENIFELNEMSDKALTEILKFLNYNECEITNIISEKKFNNTSWVIEIIVSQKEKDKYWKIEKIKKQLELYNKQNNKYINTKNLKSIIISFLYNIESAKLIYIMKRRKKDVK